MIMRSVNIRFPISLELLASQQEKAAESPRRRSMYVICGGPDQPVQALLNTFMGDSYAQPHSHKFAEKFECIEGHFAVITFGSEGTRREIRHIEAGESCEVKAGVMHTAICLSDRGTIYETKECAYDPDQDKLFANWAPAEGDPRAAAYLSHLKTHA